MHTNIDQIVRQEIEQSGPGVAVAVVMDGKPVSIKAYGLANLEWTRPIQPDTVFCLASITKQFTATAIMLLEREGKLCLDDAITTYLPDYPPSGRSITISHLLSHTSGIKNYLSIEAFPKDDAQTCASPRDVLPFFKDLPLEFEPGTRFQYSNSGYTLLGLIIEQVAQMSYEQFIQQSIFQPLGMNQSYYMHNETIIPRRASGYEKAAQGYRRAGYLNMMIPYAAGSLGSTVEDLIRWESALREGRLLDAGSQARMYMPVQLADGRRTEYGFGFRSTSYAGYRLVGHGGSIPGFHTFLGRFLDEKAMIAVLANALDIGVEKIARKIARVLFDLPQVTRPPVALSRAIREKAVGTYVTEDGLSVEIEDEEESLRLRGLIVDRLLPIDETAYYTSQDDEIEVHFADEHERVFNTLTLYIPLSRSFKALRKQR